MLWMLQLPIDPPATCAFLLFLLRFAQCRRKCMTHVLGCLPVGVQRCRERGGPAATDCYLSAAASNWSCSQASSRARQLTSRRVASSSSSVVRNEINWAGIVEFNCSLINQCSSSNSSAVALSNIATFESQSWAFVYNNWVARSLAGSAFLGFDLTSNWH